MPSKIVFLGRNFREHAAELGHDVPKEPLIFLKPPSAIIGPEEPIVLPPISQRVDYEGELAVAIGRLCSQLDRKSTRLNSSHRCISYAVFCLKKKKKNNTQQK